jgi:hypothetical protein
VIELGCRDKFRARVFGVLFSQGRADSTCYERAAVRCSAQDAWRDKRARRVVSGCGVIWGLIDAPAIEPGGVVQT